MTVRRRGIAAALAVASCCVLAAGCLESALLPVLAVPAVAAVLVQQHDGKGGSVTPAAPTPGVVTPGAPGQPGTFLTRAGVTLLVACPPVQGDVDCSAFACRAEAQAYFDAVRAAGGGDCHRLDADNDLAACEDLSATCP